MRTPGHIAATAAVLTLAAQTVAAQQKITWGPCTDHNVTNTNLTCGTLFVPLDYTDKSSNATLQLDLMKLPATKQPFKGSILFNFGGPGVAGRDSFLGQAASLNKYEIPISQ